MHTRKFLEQIGALSCLGAAKPIPALRGDRRVGGGALFSEETNVIRNHTAHYPDPHSDRCASDLAVKRWMGILSGRRTGTDSRERHHPAFAGTYIGRACGNES